MSHTTAFQRARSLQHRGQRVDALLQAARTSAARHGVRAVTLTEIASLAGVHVSGVRRYFGSREEIFLRLASEEWADWVDAVVAELGPGSANAGRVAQVLSDTLVGRPLFCDLLAHVSLSLEREVSEDVVREFKTTTLETIDRLCHALTVATGLSHDAALDFVAAVGALTGDLWQITHPPATLAGLYREDPRQAHAAGEFAPRLARLTEALLRGLR